MNIDFDARLRRRTILVAIRLHGDLQTFRGVFDVDGRVPEAESRLAGIALVLDAFLRAPFQQQDGDVEIGDVLLGDGNGDGRLRRGHLERLPRPYAFALGGEQRRGVFPWRLDHDPRRLAGPEGL